MSQLTRTEGLVGNTAIKTPVRCATTANITLSGLQTIDGVVLAAGDYVLVMSQTNQTGNGIYVADTGDWERRADFDGALDVTRGTLVMVLEGTLYSNSYWRLTTTGTVTFGTSNITFVKALVSDSSTVSFLQAGTGAVTRTMQSKERDIVSVKDFGAVGDGVTNDQPAMQLAVNAVQAAGGMVYFPDGDYLGVGVVSSDTGATLYKNVIHIPQQSGAAFHTIMPVDLVGGGGATIVVGSDATVVVRTSRAHCTHSGITVKGGTDGLAVGGGPYPNTVGWANWPDDIAAVGTQINQSYHTYRECFAYRCREGFSFQPGPMQITGGVQGNHSSLSYMNIISCHVKECNVGFRFYYPTDYASVVGAPGTQHRNACTKFNAYGCVVNSGNCGWYANGVSSLTLYGCVVEQINLGVSPCANPTGIYVPIIDYYNHAVTCFGGGAESCTRSIDNSDGTTRLFSWDEGGTAVFTEKPSNYWKTPGFNAGNFSSPTGTFVVAAGDVATFKLTIVDKTATLAVRINTATITGTPAYVKLVLPAGITVANQTIMALCGIVNNGSPWQTGYLQATAGDTGIRAYTDLAGTAWAAGVDNAYIYGQITFEIL